MPYTKPTTVMNIGDASNNANDWANNEANDSMDGDNTPNNADTIDADMLDIITQNQTNEFLDLELTASDDPEEILLAESESPPENLPSLVEPSSSDTHPEKVIEYFAYGQPGAPINDLQGSSTYELSQEVLGGHVWAPFQSKCKWDFAYWAKTNRLSFSALAKLLAIPDVHPPIFFLLLCC